MRRDNECGAKIYSAQKGIKLTDQPIINHYVYNDQTEISSGFSEIHGEINRK